MAGLFFGCEIAMSSFPQRVAEPNAACKCCGAESPLFGVVDFHKNCEEAKGKSLALSGIPIYYYRCPRCSFLFANAFDAFGADDFMRHIYNDGYASVDPDYAVARPRGSAALLGNLFRNEKPAAILDYGCGSGELVAVLKANGFPDVRGYDPFVEAFSVKPTERFDCVVSFETIEHSCDPKRTMADWNDLVSEGGLILFSTLLQPPDLEKHRLSWWYVGPRNGHVSLHTHASLAVLAAPYGLRLGSFNESLHVLYRRAPGFAKHFIVER